MEKHSPYPKVPNKYSITSANSFLTDKVTELKEAIRTADPTSALPLMTPVREKILLVENAVEAVRESVER